MIMMTDEEILKAFNRSREARLDKIVVRPKFALYKPLLLIVGMLVLICLTILLRKQLPASLAVALICAEIVLFFATQTKNILLLLIFCYQRYTPKVIRGACLFTPSCSEYMRLSILKYGVFQGVKKGFVRLRKCRPPNGGFDEP